MMHKTIHPFTWFYGSLFSSFLVMLCVMSSYSCFLQRSQGTRTSLCREKMITTFFTRFGPICSWTSIPLSIFDILNYKTLCDTWWITLLCLCFYKLFQLFNFLLPVYSSIGYDLFLYFVALTSWLSHIYL